MSRPPVVAVLVASLLGACATAPAAAPSATVPAPTPAVAVAAPTIAPAIAATVAPTAMPITMPTTAPTPAATATVVPQPTATSATTTMPAPTPRASPSAGHVGPARLYPNPALTPGDVFPGVTAREVCTPGYASSVRAVTSAEKAQVYRRYGVQNVPGVDEVDHFVSLELGGSNPLANLLVRRLPRAALKRPDSRPR